MIFKITQLKINSNKINDVREYLKKLSKSIKSFEIDQQGDLSTVYGELLNSSMLSDLKGLSSLTGLNLDIVRFMFPIERIDKVKKLLDSWKDNGSIENFYIKSNVEYGEKEIGIKSIDSELLNKFEDFRYAETPVKLLPSQRNKSN